MMCVRKKIGMVFQEGALFDSLSVYDNVAYRLHEQGVPEEEVEQEVRRMLRFVNLEDAIDKMPIELSGGMRRRVGIARALVGGPKIVHVRRADRRARPADGAHHLRAGHQAARPRRRLLHLRHARDEQRQVPDDASTRSSTTQGEVIFEKEGERLCLTNTKVMMLRDGKIIFERHGRGAPQQRRPLHPAVHPRTLKGEVMSDE